MACASHHPDITGLRCISTIPVHADHIALHEGQQVFWENLDYVAPPPRGRSKSAVAQALKDAADRVPPSQRRPVNESQPMSQVEGMAAAFDATSEEFKAAAWVAIEQIARRQAEMTTDDVWELLYSQGVDTDHRASMGTIIKSAAKRGWVEKTAKMVATQRGDQRAHGLIVWRSLIFDGENG